MSYCKAERKTANKLRKCSGHLDTTQSFQGPEPRSFSVTFSLLHYPPPPILAFWPVHTVPQAMEDKEAAGKMGRRSGGERRGKNVPASAAQCPGKTGQVTKELLIIWGKL